MLQASKVGMRFDFGLLFWGGGGLVMFSCYQRGGPAVCISKVIRLWPGETAAGSGVEMGSAENPSITHAQKRGGK